MFVALVEGPSMVPTLRHGDVLLVRRTGRIRAGMVVVARFRSGPEGLVVKRAIQPQEGGWWVESDNSYTRDDSRAYGAADVVGRVLWRWWPRPALISRRPSGTARRR